MTTTPPAQPSDDQDPEPITGTDQTNGLAGDLEGDDSGDDAGDSREPTLLGGMIDYAVNTPHADEENANKGYSEEGQP